MTIDERIEALVKASELQRESIARREATAAKQSETMDKILAGFREFRDDRVQINGTLASLIASVDKLTVNVSKLETLFTRSLTKPPNGKTD